MKYDEKELIELLADKKIHSPEMSETDEESQSRIINVYDLSWRSDEVLYLIFYFFLFVYLIFTLLLFVSVKESSLKSSQSVCSNITIGSINKKLKLQWRNATLRSPHPSNVPEWSYFQQKGQEFDTDIEGKYIKKCLICWNFMVTNTSSFRYFFLYRRKWRTPRWTLRWLLWI